MLVRDSLGGSLREGVGRDGFLDRVNHRVQLVARQFRKHRERDKLGGGSLGVFECAGAVAEIAIGFLEMNRHRVMNRAGNPLAFQDGG